jgi:hypothetical protein
LQGIYVFSTGQEQNVGREPQGKQLDAGLATVRTVNKPAARIASPHRAI